MSTVLELIPHTKTTANVLYQCLGNSEETKLETQVLLNKLEKK